APPARAAVHESSLRPAGPVGPAAVNGTGSHPAPPVAYQPPAARVHVETARIEPPAAPPPTARKTAPKPTTAATTRGGGRAAKNTAPAAPVRTDEDLLLALAEVPRDPDGTVPVRRAAAALGTG